MGKKRSSTPVKGRRRKGGEKLAPRLGEKKTHRSSQKQPKGVGPPQRSSQLKVGKHCSQSRKEESRLVQAHLRCRHLQTHQLDGIRAAVVEGSTQDVAEAAKRTGKSTAESVAGGIDRGRGRRKWRRWRKRRRWWSRWRGEDSALLTHKRLRAAAITQPWAGGDKNNN